MSNLQVMFDQTYLNVSSNLDDYVSGVGIETVKLGKKSIDVAYATGPVEVVGLDRYEPGKSPLASTGKMQSGTVDGSGDTASRDLIFDVVGAWNSVKNAKAISDGAETLTFKDFVHVEVLLGDTFTYNKAGKIVNTASSDVTIENAKRAYVVTGSGDDTVSISTLTNRVDIDKNGKSNSWYTVKLGEGADTLEFNKGNGADANGEAKKGLLVNDKSVADGRLSWATIDLGDDSDADFVYFDGVHFKEAVISNYEAGVDHIYVNGAEVTDFTNHAWIVLA